MSVGTAQRIGGAMAWSVAARAMRFALGLASSVVVVRGLGEHDYGVLSVVRSALMFVVMMAGAGTGQALLKFLPAMRVADAGGSARRLLRGVALAHGAGWLALLGTTVLLQTWIERAFHVQGIGVVMTLGVSLAVFEIFFTLAGQVLNANYDARRLAIASVASHAVYLGALLAILPGGLGVMGVLVASAAGAAAALGIAWPRLAAVVAYGDGSGEAFGAGRVLRYSLPFAVIGVLNLVVWRQSETLLLGHFRTPQETGYFDLAYRLPQTILEFVPGTVWPLVMAGMSEAFARDPASIRRVVARYYRMLFVLCAPICVSGALLAPRAVEVLFGEAMLPSALPMQVFFLIFTLSFLSTPLSMALYVLEKTHVNLLIYIALAIVNVGLDLVLIPRYGVPGAVLPVAIAIAMQAPAYFFVARRSVADLHIPLRFIARCFLACAPVVVALPLLRWVDGALGLALASVVAVVGVAVGYRVVAVLGEEELAAVRAMPVPGAVALAGFLRRSQ